MSMTATDSTPMTTPAATNARGDEVASVAPSKEIPTSEANTRVPSLADKEATVLADKEIGSLGDHDVKEKVTTDEKPASASDADEIEYPTGIKLFPIIMALVLTIFLVSLDMTIVATAIPKITDEFHGIKDVAWYSAAFFMTNGGFQTVAGKAYRYFNLKWTFLVSLFIFEVGSLICGVAPNSPALIVGRAIAGLGGAGIGTGVYTIIGFVAPPNKRPAYTGIVGMAYGLAAVIGPLIGGAFSDRVTWRWCFYINLPVGGVSALAIILFFHAPKHAKPQEAPWREILLQMDLPGAALLMGALVSFIIALQYGGLEKPWGSSTVIGLLVGFVAISAAFAVWEWFQGERAIVVPRLFMTQAVGVGSAYAFFFCGAYFLIIYYLPIYFQSIDGVSPVQSGVNNLPLIIPVTVVMVIAGIFVSKTGIVYPLLIAGAAISTIACGLLYTLDVGTGTGKWVGYQILGAVGWGMAFQQPLMVAQNTVDPKDMSSATSMILLFLAVGGSFSVAAAQSAFSNTLIKKVQMRLPEVSPQVLLATGATQIRTYFNEEQIPLIVESYADGLKIAFAISIAFSGVGFLISFATRRSRLHDGKGEAPSAAMA